MNKYVFMCYPSDEYQTDNDIVYKINKRLKFFSHSDNRWIDSIFDNINELGAITIMEFYE